MTTDAHPVVGSAAGSAEQHPLAEAAQLPEDAAQLAGGGEVVELSLEQDLVRIKPAVMLGGDRFDAFREAIEGAGFNRKVRANCATPDKMDRIIGRLRKSRFAVAYAGHDGGKACRIALQERVAKDWFDQQAIVERIRVIDQDFYDRTKKKEGSGKRIFSYQHYGIHWLASRHGALLADEQGVGKTLQTIVALPQNAPTLIVCPAGMKFIWLQDFNRIRPQLTPEVLEGRGSFRWPKVGETIITNYDVLPKIHKEGCNGFFPVPPPRPCPGCRKRLDMSGPNVQTIIEGHVPACDQRKNLLEPEPPRRCPGCHPILEGATPGTTLAFDEGHRTKSHKSDRGLNARALGRAARAKQGRTWVLTGTPLTTEPWDLWYVCDLAGIAEECFGSREKFKKLFHGRQLETKNFVWGVPDEEVIERLQRGALRRMKRDVLTQIPPKIYVEVSVDIDAATIRLADKVIEAIGGIDRFASDLEQWIDKETIPFEKISAIRAALARAKIPALLERLKTCEGQPVVVFSWHRDPIEAIRNQNLAGWRFITGAESPKERAETVKLFSEGKLAGVGCTIKAAGEGFTLLPCSRQIFVDQSYVPSDNEQAEDRCHRIGQTCGLIVEILRGNHVLDERLVAALARRRRIIAASVDAASMSGEVHGDVGSKFLDELKRVQAEIACGAPVRRMPETSEERKYVDDLYTLTFPDRIARMARDLAEQVLLRGLSSAQWRLVGSLVGETRRLLAKGDADEVVLRAVDGEIADREEASRVQRLPQRGVKGSPSDKVKKKTAKDVAQSRSAMVDIDPLNGTERPCSTASQKGRSAMKSGKSGQPKVAKPIDPAVDDARGFLRRLKPIERSAVFEFVELLGQTEEEEYPRVTAEMTRFLALTFPQQRSFVRLAGGEFYWECGHERVAGEDECPHDDCTGDEEGDEDEGEDDDGDDEGEDEDTNVGEDNGGEVEDDDEGRAADDD